jgi:hypothetical protein
MNHVLLLTAATFLSTDPTPLPAVPSGPPKVVVVPARELIKPVEQVVKTGEPLTLSADRPCKWEPCNESDLRVVREPDGRRATIVAPKAGKYKLFVYGSDGSDPTVYLIVAEGENVVPPGPNPTPIPPQPTPPVPPTPVDPNAALKKRVLDTLAKDGAEGFLKLENRRKLAGLYRQLSDITGDASIKSGSTLMARYKKAADDYVGKDTLPLVRALVAELLDAVLPTVPGVALTDEIRQATAALFKLLAEILEPPPVPK